MLGRVFSGENGGRAASGVAAEKKFFFFSLSTFLVHCYREPIHGNFYVIHAARDQKHKSKHVDKVNINIK
jgi:hypothetical protein